MNYITLKKKNLESLNKKFDKTFHTCSCVD